MSPELFSYVSKFEILPFDPLLSDVHNGIAVEFISKPLQQTVVQTEEQSTKNVNGQMRKKMLFLMQLIYYMCYILNTPCLILYLLNVRMLIRLLLIHLLKIVTQFYHMTSRLGVK